MGPVVQGMQVWLGMVFKLDVDLVSHHHLSYTTVQRVYSCCHAWVATSLVYLPIPQLPGRLNQK